jgi:outer membrane protein assembly factor BamB
MRASEGDESPSNDVLVALNATTAEDVWRFPTGAGGFASASVAGDAVYAGTLGGMVYAVEAETGQERWHIDVAGSVDSSPVVVDGFAYVATSGGEVIAIEGGGS